MSEENVEIVRQFLDAWNRGTRRSCRRSLTPRSSTSIPRRRLSRERGAVPTKYNAVWRMQWEIVLDGRAEIDRI